MTIVSIQQEELYARVAWIVETARGRIARTVDTAMVHAYWSIGRAIVEVEQRGESRADYGEQTISELSARLTERFGRGFSASNLKNMRQFYLSYPNGSALRSSTDQRIRETVAGEFGEEKIRQTASSELEKVVEHQLFPSSLGWSHYLLLTRVADLRARNFYEIEAVRESWSKRELERQIGSLLFERLAKSRDKEQVLSLARNGQSISVPKDVIKDPFVLEFLGLEEQHAWQERDLEQAIIDRLESFLLELGKGFCFVARQKRITIEGDHFYIDLTFYNRLLRCFVLVDLKLGKLTHQDLGQMQMYVNYFDQTQREDFEAPTVGIVLCSDKNDTMAKITLAENDQRIHATRYQLYLPSEAELCAELESERDRAEEALRAKSASAESNDESR